MTAPDMTGPDRPDRSHLGPAARRLHVLHVSTVAEGEIGHLVLEYVRDQVARGWSVTVACPSSGDLGYAAREAGAQVWWWPAGPTRRRGSGRGGRLGRGGLVGQARRLARIVAATAPDVVHAHGTRAGCIGRLVLRHRVPTVYQPHGQVFLGSRLAVDPGLRRRARRWERFATRWTSEVVCVSRAELDRAVRVGVTGPATGVGATVVGSGIDVTRWRARGPADRDAARARIGVADEPLAVCLGRLASDRGQRDLLAVWPDVRRRVPGAGLVLVGEGPDRPLLERWAGPGVRLVGARTDVGTWLAAADLVIVPSRSGRDQLVPLLAMASARSVVATDAGGLAELVPDRAGAVVVAGDREALAAAVARRLVDPALADEEGWRGRQRAERHHDVAASARALARVYPRLLLARRA